MVKGVCGERGVMIGGVVKEVDPEADTTQDPEADFPHPDPETDPR